MKPVTKLNLNMNPSVCTDGSLVFAKNMKVDKDGCLINDYGYEQIEALNGYNIVGHIVGLDNKIYLFTDNLKAVKTGSKKEVIDYTGEETNLIEHDITKTFETSSFFKGVKDNKYYFIIESSDFNDNANDDYKLSKLGFVSDAFDTYYGFYINYNSELNITNFYNKFIEKIKEIVSLKTTINYDTTTIIEGNDLSDTIVTSIIVTEDSIEIPIKGFIINEDKSLDEKSVYRYKSSSIPVSDNSVEIEIPIYKQVNTILEFDEVSKTIDVIKCGWKYNKGHIDGCVTTNISGEKILTIGEYDSTQIVEKYTPAIHSGIVLRALRNGAVEPAIVDGRDELVAAPVIQSVDNTDSNIEFNRFTDSSIRIPQVVDNEETFITRQVGVKLSTISEFKNNNSETTKEVKLLVPLKHINLKYCSYTDDESIYTQAPKVPIANLNLIGTYAKTIPNGSYVFFIRYQIRKDVYTNWYLCSRPMFAGTSEHINTIQGGLKYINTHKDSAKAFIFELSFIDNDIKSLYSKFQLGFIISHEDSVNARSWKSFDINTTSIYFDYDNVEEIDIDSLQKVNYELYNVENITSFKNKLYISNYKEYDFNPVDIKSLANNISLNVIKTTNETTEQSLRLNGYLLHYDSNKGYYDSLANGGSISPLIRDILFNFTYNNDNNPTTTTYNDAVTFLIQFDKDNNPDIITVYNINNKVNGRKPFGDTWTPQFGDGRLGIIEHYFYLNNWYFVADTNNLHPWYNLGLTFMYGSYIGNYRDDYYKDGVVFISRDSQRLFQKDDAFLGWICHDKGFDTPGVYKTIDDNIKSEIHSKETLVYAYAYVTSGATNYKIDYVSDYDTNNYIIDRFDEGVDNTDIQDAVRKSRITAKITTVIQNHIVGVTQNGTPVLRINGTDIQTNAITVVFKQYKFDVTNEDTSPEGILQHTYKVDLKTTDYKYRCTFTFKDDVITITEGDISVSSQASTLMPHSKYKAYAHFVDEHNLITNGVYISDIQTGGIDTITNVLSLQYSVSNITNPKYKAFFISLENTGSKIIEGFAYSKDGNNNYLHSIELDSLLYNLNDNIKIINNNGEVITTSAKYYPSGESNPTLAFGNCGYIHWQDDIDYSDNVLFIEIETDNNEVETNALIKATNYLPLVNTEDTIIYDGFYGSYLCSIKKPSFALSSDCYVSGTDIYKVTRGYPLILEPFSDTISIQDSPTYIVRSNFNLNYLNLSEDIKDQIFSIDNAAKQRQVAKVINSATLSSIYELTSMYKDFSNILFNKFTEYAKTEFNNTVRVSNTLADESFNNSVFIFEPTDYYNIPTDRGVIVKLFSINNDIVIHTKGSLYKFDANNIIVTQEDDIKLKESDPFDTGITQILDSQFGYGGLDNKEAGCVTFDSYFFFDNVSKHIFGYGGNNQIITIDDTIYKFIEAYKPSICRTIHDEKNDRVLFEFVSGRSEDANKTYKSFCISYNYKTKSFISLHDLTLLNSFNSRYNCYSYKNNFVSLFANLENIDTTVIEDDNGTWNIYGDATIPSLVSFGTTVYDKNKSPFNIAIITLALENTREALNNITYIANIVKSAIIKQESIGDLFTITQQDVENPVSRFYAITDICMSSEIDTTIDDTVRPNSLLNYKGFKYNLGSWNGNYFRNILNANNVYEYPNQPGTGRDIVSDNNSLVYGRYFVLFFEFVKDKPIKFEDILINANEY